MLRRLAELVAAWFLQWLPPDAASLANVPWGGGGEPSAEERGPDDAERPGRRRRGPRRRSGRADEPGR